MENSKFTDIDSFARLHLDNQKRLPPWNALKPKPDESKISVFHRAKSKNAECHEKGIVSEEKRNKTYNGFLVLMYKRLTASLLISDIIQCTEDNDESHCHIVYTHTFVRNETPPPEIRKELNDIINDSSFIEYHRID